MPDPGAQPTLDDLRPEVVMAAASAATGLTDFGDLGFVAGLTIFLDDLRSVSGLHQEGISAQFIDAVRILSNRLVFQRDLARHPEIRAEPIEQPIIVTGMVRTGTSKLQRMIAADPCAQRLEMWRLLFPAPFPGTEGATPDPRIAAAAGIEAMLTARYPEVMARHPMETREPDEEWFLMEMSYESSMSSIKTYAPNHRRWIENRSQRTTYRYLHSLLQYLQWQDGGARGRPWILKSPAHLGELTLLLETFPDATVVHCHRHPREVIASFAALMEATWLRNSDRVDMHELGHGFNAYWGRQAARNVEARRQLAADRVLDAYFEDICERPVAIIEQIYARTGRALTSAARQAFACYGARRPRGFFGRYASDMRRYGLTDADIEAAFASYLDTFPRLRSQGT